MQILLDTHAFLWLVTGNGRLSAAAHRAYLDPHHRLYLSMASIWEMAIKVSLGKLAMNADWPRRVVGEMAANDIHWLAIEPDHCIAVATLPFHHRDPFDRLLVAQALREGLTMLTADRHFVDYGISCIW